MREMKDSGIEWIGEMPRTWNLRRLRFLCEITTGNMDTQDNNPEGQYPFYVRSPIIERSDKYTFDNEAILMAGDGVGAGKVFHYIKGKYGCHQRVYSMSAFKDIIAKYLYYYMSENFYKKIEESNAKSTVDSVRLPMLKDFYVAFPDLKYQYRIVDYLDKKCSKVDTVIEKQQEIIENLKEYKLSVITERVTKGLNPNVDMKNSGLEWIGNISTNWKVVRIKNIASLAGRIGWQGLTSEEYSDEGAFLITGINFDNGNIDWDSCVHVPMSRWEEASQIQIQEGDLLITKDGTVGKTAIVSDVPGPTSLNSGVLLIRTCDECYTKYLYWIIKSNVFWKWFGIINSGNSTIIHLYQHSFENFSFPLPSIEEQKRISEYLDKKCYVIDEIINNKNKLIEKYREYKKSLIYEVVTGKKEI